MLPRRRHNRTTWIAARLALFILLAMPLLSVSGCTTVLVRYPVPEQSLDSARPMEPDGMFDPVYMRALYELGY